jgi:AraC family cel operon transcriptional repressor
MELLRELSGTRRPLVSDKEPGWLTSLVHRLEEPAVMAGGTAEIARQAHRTPQHVNAALKKFRGMTSTGMLNEARMRYAMRELRTSTKKILEICFDCGFENLSHFYEIFRRHAGVTPRTYRLRHQELLC